MARTDRILIVEDEGIVALELTERLQALGFEVIGPTSTGEAAMELAERERPDLVLMDVRLKGQIDGPEAAAHIRKTLGIPAVFLTAHADDDTLARIKPVEPLAYVIKPFEERSLGVTIEMALHRHRATLARERAERARRRLEARLAAVLDHTHDGVVSVDSERRIHVFNKGAERIFGYAAADVLGGPLDVLLPDSLRAEHAAHVSRFEAGQEVARPMGSVREVFGRRKDGESFAAEVAISKIEFESEVLLTACIRDISDRRRLESQLMHAQKLEAVGRLAASVAHDFNNLLAAVQSNAYLASTAPDPADFVGEIFSLVERGVALTRQLLAFSRPAATEVRVLDVHGLVGQFAPLVRRLLREDVALVLDVPETPAWVRADAHMLEQVLMNLVLNARDALSKGGRVGIRSRVVTVDADGEASPEHCRLEVWDDGDGISPDLAARIFEPFFTTKPAGMGTGLGLATVRSIVQQIGGEVLVRPREPKGSVFSVSLPTVAPPVPLSETPSHQSVPPTGTETVLLVEDDEAILDAMASILEQHGYAVLRARSCAEAREQLQRDGPPADLIVSDVVLPDGFGYDLADMNGPGGRPAIFLTGYSDLADGDVADPGRTSVLAKPVQPARLLAAVRRCLDAHPAPVESLP